MRMFDVKQYRIIHTQEIHTRTHDHTHVIDTQIDGQDTLRKHHLYHSLIDPSGP